MRVVLIWGRGIEWQPEKHQRDCEYSTRIHKEAVREGLKQTVEERESLLYRRRNFDSILDCENVENRKYAQ